MTAKTKPLKAGKKTEGGSKSSKERKSLGILDNFRVKGYAPGDFNYVCKYFLDFARTNTAIGRTTSKTIFIEEHKKLLRSVMLDSRVYIATDKEDSNLHAGFIIAQRLGHIDVVHFMLVKEAYRNEGIGQMLINHVKKKDRLIVTHKTKDSEKTGIFEKNWSNVVYNPYMFLNGDYRDS